MVRVLFTFVLLVAASGCARIEVVDSRDSEDKTGVLTYPARPFLLVSKSETGTVTKVISLPDYSRPRLVRQTGWFGTTEMNFTLDNGMIVSAGAKSDSKTPETLTAIAGGVASLATGFKTVKEGLEITGSAKPAFIGPTIDQKTTVKVNAIAEAQAQLKIAADMLDEKDDFERRLRDIIKTTAAELNPQIVVDANANVDEALAKYFNENVKPKIKPLTRVQGELASSIEKMKEDPKVRIPIYLTVAKNVSGVIGRLSALLPAESDSKLYRIDFDSSGNIYFTETPLPFTP
jgi:hypothetical protein